MFSWSRVLLDKPAARLLGSWSRDSLEKPAARLLGSWEVVVSRGSEVEVGFSC